MKTSEVVQEILDEVTAAQMSVDSLCNQALNADDEEIAEDLRGIHARLETIATKAKTLAGE